MRFYALVALAALLAAVAAPALAQRNDVAQCADTSTGIGLTVDKSATGTGRDWTTSGYLAAQIDRFGDDLSATATEDFTNFNGNAYETVFGGDFGGASYSGFATDDGVDAGGAGNTARIGSAGASATITFTQPQRAVAFIATGFDASTFVGASASFTLASGAVETKHFDTDEVPETPYNAALFSTVRAADSGDWVASVTVTKSSAGAYLAIDNLVVGSCPRAGTSSARAVHSSSTRIVRAAAVGDADVVVGCGCESATATSETTTASISFTEGASCDGVAIETFSLAGNVRNAVTNAVVSGVTVTLSDGQTTTGSPYSFTSVPAGSVTVTATADGYASSSIVVDVTGDVTGANLVLSPLLGTSNDWRLVVTWGASPPDLDSHLLTPSCSVYYGRKNCPLNGGGTASLDVDDVDGYGPETITINGAADADTYLYYVYRYSSGGTLSSSGARVQIFQGSSAEAVYDVNVPSSSGDERYWSVIRITGSTFSVVNALTSTSPSL